MSNKIYTMPRNRFEPPKRRVPLRLLYAFFTPLWLGWYFIRDKEVDWVTHILALVGITYISRGFARFYLDERATYQELKRMKEYRADVPPLS